MKNGTDLMRKSYAVFDCDAHINDPIDIWEKYIACNDCGHYLSPADGNYKLGCGRIDGTLQDIDPFLFGDTEEELEDRMAYRSYVCPACGVLFENELARTDEPPFWDVRLDLR